MATPETEATPAGASYVWNLDAPAFVPRIEKRENGGNKDSPQGGDKDCGWVDLVSRKIGELANGGDVAAAAVADLLRHGRRLPPISEAEAEAIADATFAASTGIEPAIAALLCTLATGSPPALPGLLPTILRASARQSEAICARIAADGSLRDPDGHHLELLSHLLACLPDQPDQEPRRCLARHLLAPLAKAAAAVGNPEAAAAAFRATRTALAIAGRRLDAASAADADTAEAVAGIYARIRAALSAGGVGCSEVAAGLIDLLELRAAGWCRDGAPHLAAAGPPARVEANGDCGGGCGMTDDMFAEFERFLRDSGQVAD